MSTRLRSLVVAGVLFMAAPFANAQTPASAFPTKPITMVVAFGTGTGSDILARLLSPHLGKFLGTAVIVENRPGAGGVIGTEMVARAAPDGYTLTLGSTSSLGTTPLINPAAKYSVRDFAFVAGLAKTDYVFITANTPDTPKTLQELVSRLKAKPGSFGSAGIMTITHLTSEVLLYRAGLQATHVPYKGSGQVVAEVMGGHVMFAAESPAATLAMVKGGKLRALATTGAKRIPTLPDVPTVAESGFPGFNVVAWWGLAAPAGTPPDVIKRLGDAVAKAMAVPEVSAQLRNMEIEPMLLAPAEFTEFIRKDVPFWTDFIRASNLKFAP